MITKIYYRVIYNIINRLTICIKVQVYAKIAKISILILIKLEIQN